ncbi:hypothetical protein EG835_06505, partial [bacterium]|nr:hypothetical protein [bacterium]
MQLRRHNPAFRFACVATVCLALLTGQAAAAPVDGQPSATDAQTVTVDVRQPTPSIATQGRMRATVDVTLSAPAEYVEVRFRLRQPGGRLVYQKTEVRANSGPGTYAIEFEHDLRSLDLEQGRYPIEVRVLATGSTATTVSSRLLLIEPGETDLPVALVVRASAVPAVTADGRFAIDPMDDTHLRDDLAFVTQLASDRRAPLALAIPPVLTEQLGRAEAGYE